MLPKGLLKTNVINKKQIQKPSKNCFLVWFFLQKRSTCIAKRKFLDDICICFLFITLVFSNPLGNNKDVYFSKKDTLAKTYSHWSLIYSSRSIISPLKKFAKFFELSSSVSPLDIFVDELVFGSIFFNGRKLFTSFWFISGVFVWLL